MLEIVGSLTINLTHKHILDSKPGHMITYWNHNNISGLRSTYGK